MFHQPAPAPVTTLKPAASAIRTAWAPTRGTKFCPTCLAGNGGRFQLTWRLPWSFLCPHHDQPLATSCPRCHRPPHTGRIKATGQRPGYCHTRLPHQPGRPPGSCDTDLSTATGSATDRPDQTRHAQLFIDGLLARLAGTEPGSTDHRSVVETLTDLTIIAEHLATNPARARHQQVRAHMLHADTLTAAVGILTATGAGTSADPLHPLVRHHLRGRKATGVPESWRPASPSLHTRIAHGRDASLSATDRIRYATTLPARLRPPQSSTVDPATTRANRLPDQLWPAWAFRLLDDPHVDPMPFRHATLVALLLPHSSLPLTKAAALISTQLTSEANENQLSMLGRTPNGGTALRILTELALALDQQRIPINYQRRRRLAAATPLLDQTTWKRLTRHAHHHPGRSYRLDLARRYLYELLTGGGLDIAPPPYTLRALTRTNYHRFVLELPDTLVDALAEHARNLLTAAGITDEPLQWQPPTDWVSITRWPGADPDQTDPTPLHRALRAGQPIGLIARNHGISNEHVRHVVRCHPIPGPAAPRARAGSILPLDAATAADPRLRSPGAFYVDLAWLREQYVTCQRSLAEIATEIGCGMVTLYAFAKQHGVPLRPPGGGDHYIHRGVTSGSRLDLPHPLRGALTGRQARQRVERFLLIAEHRNLRRIAEQIGITSSVLTDQLATLERRCGGLLIHRRRSTSLGDLTPLGEQLREQAQCHLNQHHGTVHPSEPPTRGSQTTDTPNRKVEPHAPSDR